MCYDERGFLLGVLLYNSVCMGGVGEGRGEFYNRGRKITEIISLK